MGLKNQKDSYMDNQFMTTVFLPEHLMKTCYKLVGGDNPSYVNDGIIRAIELAHERSIRNNSGNGVRL
jgi:hypothetical protein